ncbi:MAG: thioesterase family protein [Synechococcales bacterium]|nr:thioesterase family protein [Synechococcales bacterium]
MAFSYLRTIRLADTDAAGVAYFASILSICHEAYEASLAASAISLQTFFTGSERAIPIVQTQATFLQPLFCGEIYQIDLIPEPLKRDEFAIAYTLHPAPLTGEHELEESPQKPVAIAHTRHVCIHPGERTRRELPDEIQGWITRWGRS